MHLEVLDMKIKINIGIKKFLFQNALKKKQKK